MRSSLCVAVAQPRCSPRDPAANAAAHAELIARADAHVVVLPELSLCGDELDVAAIDLAGPELQALVGACGAAEATALVGAAVGEGGRRHIATLEVSASGARIAYRKMCLGGDEPTWFSPGGSPEVVEVGGRRIGLGICKDTRIDDHLQATLEQRIDLYVAGLVHAPDEVDDLEQRAQRITALGRIPVAFASAAGPVGSAYPPTAGHSAIWSAAGGVLARCTAAPGEIATVVLR